MSAQSPYLIAAPVLASDRATLHALQDIPAYAPRNPELSTGSLTTLEEELTQAQLETERIRLALEAAHAREIAAGWKFHERVISAKTEVIAQFGADSQEVHAIGLKKKSERKRPVRRRTPPKI